MPPTASSTEVSTQRPSANHHAKGPTLQTFTVDPAILRTLIEHQKTSLQRAVAEAVMNAVDAGATQVHLTLTPTHLSIQDDGKGLLPAEVQKYFATFGFDHTTQEEAGKRVYGAYGMGRGALFAYGKVEWYTGHLQLSVDVRAHGLAFEQRNVPEHQAGLRIEVELYEALKDPSKGYMRDEFLEISRTLKTHFCFLQSTQVYLGETLLNEPLPAWDFEDEHAFYKIGGVEDHHLTVYNQGMLVQHGSSGYGMNAQPRPTGVINSKRPLGLNITRTELLDEEISTFRTVLTRLHRQARRDRLRSRKKLTETDLNGLIRDLTQGNERWEDSADLRMIEDVCGGQYTLEDFLAVTERGKRVVAVSEVDTLHADKAQQQGLALVLHPKVFKRFGADSMQEFVDVLSRMLMYRHLSASKRARLEDKLCAGVYHEDLYHAVPELLSEGSLVPRKEWSPEELAMQQALTYINRQLADVMCKVTKRPSGGVDNCGYLGFRRVVLGESAHLDGWTDGWEYIAINRLRARTLKKGGAVAFQNLVLLLLHEYAHHRDDPMTHDHGFMLAFHNAAMDPETQRRGGYGWQKYLRELEK